MRLYEQACTHDVSHSPMQSLYSLQFNSMHERNKRVTKQCMSGVPYIYVYENQTRLHILELRTAESHQFSKRLHLFHLIKDKRCKKLSQGK